MTASSLFCAANAGRIVFPNRNPRDRRRTQEGENARLEEETQLALLPMLLLVHLHFELDVMTKLGDCTVQRSAKVDAPGCVNAAGKLGQK